MNARLFDPAAGLRYAPASDFAFAAAAFMSPPPVPPHDEDWDAGELGCGELVMNLRFLLKAMRPGQVIRVRATDTGAVEDLPAWCRMTKDTLLHHDPQQSFYYIARGSY